MEISSIFKQVIWLCLALLSVGIQGGTSTVSKVLTLGTVEISPIPTTIRPTIEVVPESSTTITTTLPLVYSTRYTTFSTYIVQQSSDWNETTTSISASSSGSNTLTSALTTATVGTTASLSRTSTVTSSPTSTLSTGPTTPSNVTIIRTSKNTPAIIGAAVGAGMGAIIVVILVHWCCTRRNKNDQGNRRSAFNWRIGKWLSGINPLAPPPSIRGKTISHPIPIPPQPRPPRPPRPSSLTGSTIDVFGAIGPAVHAMSQSEKTPSEAPINHQRNMSDTTPTWTPATPEQLDRVIDDTIESYQGTGGSYNSSHLRVSEDSFRQHGNEDPYTFVGATGNNWSAPSWRLPPVADFRADEDEDNEEVKKFHRAKALKALEVYDTRADLELRDVHRERNLAGMSNMPPPPETPTKNSGMFGMRCYRK